MPAGGQGPAPYRRVKAHSHAAKTARADPPPAAPGGSSGHRPAPEDAECCSVAAILATSSTRRWSFGSSDLNHSPRASELGRGARPGRVQEHRLRPNEGGVEARVMTVLYEVFGTHAATLAPVARRAHPHSRLPLSRCTKRSDTAACFDPCENSASKAADRQARRCAANRCSARMKLAAPIKMMRAARPSQRWPHRSVSAAACSLCSWLARAERVFASSTTAASV